MHKRVYTVTLDIECWDDLKVTKIDWAKRIGLFPDEYIHSSVQESWKRPGQWTVSEVAQSKLTGMIDCGKLHPDCYRRLQILFQSSGSDEGLRSVLPQTLVFVIYSL